MGKVFVLFAALSFCMLSSCSKQIMVVNSKGLEQTNKLVGTWKMTSLRYTYPNGEVFYLKNIDYPDIKIFDKYYYLFGRQNWKSQRLGAAGGGKYYLQGDSMLITVPDFHSVDELVGKQVKYKVVLENETYFQKGLLPNKVVIEEWYERIKQ